MKPTSKIALILIAIAFLGIGVYANHSSKSDTSKPTKKNIVEGFNKHQYSLTNPASQWVIVNKQRSLPDGYAPTDLVVPSVPLRLEASAQQMHVREIVSGPLQELFNDAKNQAVNYKIASGYRSAEYQATLYKSYVQLQGQEQADTLSARPGFSEHQTGLAVDIDNAGQECELETCFAETSGGKWLAANAYKYGFTIRYLSGKTPITGYSFEPWHIRYVGKALAAQLQKNGQSLEEFFSLPAAPGYN